MVSHADVAHSNRFGYVVLRRAFDPQPLSDEVDRAFREGSRAFGAGQGGAVSRQHQLAPTPTTTSRADLYPSYGEHWRASGRP